MFKCMYVFIDLIDIANRLAKVTLGVSQWNRRTKATGIKIKYSKYLESKKTVIE